MQLRKRKRRAGAVRESLATISVGLLAATFSGHSDPAEAQSYYNSGVDSSHNTFGPGIAYSEIDAALMVYQEAGGRVMAIEPVASLNVHGADGRELTLEVIADAVSGATPNGAVPSDKAQNFVTPIKAYGSSMTVTSASGGSTIIQLPPTPGQIAQAAFGRQYTAAANTLPMDRGFQDHRAAANFSWSQPLGGISLVGFGGGYSQEQDYRAITGNVRVAQNFNSDNTTISLSLNSEFDSSFPFGGVPTPLTTMNAQWKTPTSRSKTQLGFVVGLTEVMSRRWLMQINYSFDVQKGYQNDPYRVISVVDPTTGEPTDTLYENRPNNRSSQSVFWENKFDLDPFITDLSLRYYRDSWGVTSKTAELAERVNLGHSIYMEPSVRWYSQTQANFYHAYLVGGNPLPSYASSDTRLGTFTSLTYGMKVGFKPTGRTELYVRGGIYKQSGNGNPADAFGQLQQQNLFAGTKAGFVFIGYKWDFH